MSKIRTRYILVRHEGVSTPTRMIRDLYDLVLNMKTINAKAAAEAILAAAHRNGAPESIKELRDRFRKGSKSGALFTLILRYSGLRGDKTGFTVSVRDVKWGKIGEQDRR